MSRRLLLLGAMLAALMLAGAGVWALAAPRGPASTVIVEREQGLRPLDRAQGATTEADCACPMSAAGRAGPAAPSRSATP